MLIHHNALIVLLLSILIFIQTKIYIFKELEWSTLPFFGGCSCSLMNRFNRASHAQHTLIQFELKSICEYGLVLSTEDLCVADCVCVSMLPSIYDIVLS